MLSLLSKLVSELTSENVRAIEFALCFRNKVRPLPKFERELSDQLASWP